LLNRQVCRLKDIQDLFMDTGLGPDSYSVIELKMVEDILSERTDSRRHLFEEAAGITRFKGRRRAAMSKLESTRLDMQRIEDILSEVRRNVNSLKRQVSRARRYQESQSALRDQELLLLASEQRFHQERLHPLQEEMTVARKRIAELAQEETGQRTDLTRYQAELSSLETDFAYKQGELDRIRRGYHEKNSELIVQREQRKHALLTVDNAREDRRKLEAQLEKASERQVELTMQENQLSTRIAQLEKSRTIAVKGLEEDEHKLVRHHEQAETHRHNFLNLLEALAPVERDISKRESTISGGQERVQKLTEEVKRLQESIDGNRSRLEQVQDDQQRLGKKQQEAEKQQARLQTELQQATTGLREQERQVLEAGLEVKNLHSRIEFLENLLTRHEGLPGGTKLVVQAELPGIRGVLGDAVSAPPELVPAVETALGAAAHYLLAESRTAINGARGLLLAETRGQATFVDLSRLSELPPVDRLPDNALVKRLDCSKELRPLLEYLLADVVYLDEAELDAQTIGARFVNKQGEMIIPPVLQVTGHRSPGDLSAIGKSYQLDKYRQQLEEATAEKTRQEEVLQEVVVVERQVANSVVEATAALESIRQHSRELETEQQRLTEATTHYRNLLSMHTTEEESWRQRLQQLEQELAVSREEKTRLTAQRVTLEEGNAAITEQLALQELAVSRLRNEVQQEHILLVEQQGALRALVTEREELERFSLESEEQLCDYGEVIERQTVMEKELQVSSREWEQQLVAAGLQISQEEEVLSSSTRELDAKRQSLRELQQSLDKDRAEDSKLRERIHDIELEIRETDIRLQNRREMLKEEYDLELEQSHLEAIDPEISREELDEVQQEVQRLRELRRRLGPVNLLALEEFDQEQERLDFLEKQRDDLKQSEEMLLETISKINRVARERFEETFKKIQANFEYLFGKLFYDGKARLTLDSGDPLEADVGIYAAPSGKKIQHLLLLSGGEKTLTAIALLFSIYMVKPSPFCILDEVDAPLDDSNITKFNILIREFTDETQFIIITHNKRTMEYADTMFGVTMAEEGVSSIVSVKFNEEMA
ncbi:chromosome segregation protein SMC, partial [bacterium]|nr:chromosome segregation protein SMC [bacterium]